MTDLTTAMEAELSADVYLPFGAIEIALPGGAFLRLLDGPGHLFFDGFGWVGEDTTYGSLLSFEPISDGDQDEVPAVTVSIAVPSAEAPSVSARDCARALSYHKVPGYIAFVRDLPLSSTKKLARGDIKAMAAQAVTGGTAFDLRALKAALRKAEAPKA